jgi:hypothetical protein
MSTVGTQQICDYALNQIERAPIQVHPFPHIIIEHFLPDELFQDLIAHFPDRSEFQRVSYPGTGHGKRTSRFQENGLALKNMKDHEYFGLLHELFASEAFSRALLDKFGKPLPDGSTPIPAAKHHMFSNGAHDYSCVFDFQIDQPGYEIPPHPDVMSKIVTFQFFLVDDDSLRDFGTLFCKSKNGKSPVKRPLIARATRRVIDKVVSVLKLENTSLFRRLEQSRLGLWFGVGTTRNWLPWGLFDIAKIAPAAPNHFMAFAPNDISYHAVRMDIPAESKRQERPVIRGFIRAGRDTANWIRSVM